MRSSSPEPSGFTLLLRIKVVITGKFVSKTLIRGTIRYSTTAPKHCDTGTIKYAAKLGKLRRGLGPLRAVAVPRALNFLS